MIAILQPHREPYFGQDFTSQYLIKEMGFFPLFIKNGSYYVPQEIRDKITLIVSRYPDRQEDLNIIEEFAGATTIIIHLHLRYSFYTNKQKVILKKSLHRSNLCIANCEMLRSEYRKIFPENFWITIDNGIDPIDFYPVDDAQSKLFRDLNGIPVEKTVLSYVGRLTNTKGLQILEKLLDYVSHSKEFWMVIQLIYLPKYKMEVDRILSKHNNLTIYLNQDVKTVRFADLNINPSLCETTSRTNLEALFSGIPVICTDVSPFFEELEFVNRLSPMFHKIKMPCCGVISKQDKYSLSLDEKATSDLVENFINAINSVRPLSYIEKIHVHTAMLQSKFTIKRMAYSINKVYSQYTNVVYKG